MVHQAVNGRRRGHRVLEDLLPFAKGKIARQQHAAVFVSLGQQREEHFHLLSSLLNVS